MEIGTTFLFLLVSEPALIAKSNIILDVKPWDDETDMAKMEEEVRKITTDGLLWGAGEFFLRLQLISGVLLISIAAKLVPLAYGIKKLQISSVVEDDKVSVDWLQEQIEALEDYVCVKIINCVLLKMSVVGTKRGHRGV